MPKFAFIFHRDVYLRHVIEAATYQEAENLALEADDYDGVIFSTPFFLMQTSRQMSQDAFVEIQEIS